MTADGKVTASRVTEGTLVLVTNYRATAYSPAGWHASQTKVKNAERLTVTKVDAAKVGRVTGRQITGTLDNGDTVTLIAAPAQTFWLAKVPSRPEPKPVGRRQRPDGLAAVAAAMQAEVKPQPAPAQPAAPSPAAVRKGAWEPPQAKLLEAQPTRKNTDFARYCTEQTGYQVDPVAAMVLLRLHREWQKSERGQALKGSDTARERKPKTVRRSLPFDPETATDEEIIAAVRPGSRLVWENAITGQADSADVYCRRETNGAGKTVKAPHLPLRSLKITSATAGRRVLTFPSEDGGIRSVALDRLVSVR